MIFGGFNWKIAPTARRGFIFYEIFDKMCLSLSDPDVSIRDKGGDNNVKVNPRSA